MKKPYFFYHREYHGEFYDIVIEAWYGEQTFYVCDNMQGESFSLLEKLTLHACKRHSENERNRYHCIRFENERGLNLASGISAKTEKEFLQKKANCQFHPMQQITKRDFLRFKKFMMNYYNNYSEVDYDNLGKSTKIRTYTNI